MSETIFIDCIVMDHAHSTHQSAKILFDVGIFTTKYANICLKMLNLDSNLSLASLREIFSSKLSVHL